jgi:chromosome segregation ATPase
MRNTEDTVTNEQIMAAIKGLSAKAQDNTDSIQETKNDVSNLTQNVSGLTQSMRSLAQSVGSLTQSLDSFITTTKKHFEKIDTSLQEIHGRLDNVEGEVRMLKFEVQELKQTSYRHELQLDETNELAKSTYAEQLNMHKDINELFHRAKALHRRIAPKLKHKPAV